MYLRRPSCNLCVLREAEGMEEESMSIVKFNQIKYDEKQLVELRKRIDDTITTIELSGDGARRTPAQN